MNRHTVEMLGRLQKAGISSDDALALRRIAMTLHRWHELECGDSNDHGAWCITRGHFDTRECKFWDGKGERPKPVFQHNDDGAPYLEHHHYRHGKGQDTVSYTKLADREKGARKRLAKIMAKYPDFGHEIQGDPRGASLTIYTPNSHSIAVYK